MTEEEDSARAMEERKNRNKKGQVAQAAARELTKIPEPEKEKGSMNARRESIGRAVKHQRQITPSAANKRRLSVDTGVNKKQKIPSLPRNLLGSSRIFDC